MSDKSAIGASARAVEVSTYSDGTAASAADIAVTLRSRLMLEYFATDAASDELPDPPEELLLRWRQVIAADVDTEIVPDSVDDLRARLGRSA